MSERRLVDTNIIVRYLVRDESPDVATAEKVFAQCEAGALTLVLLPAVLAECVYVLGSFYDLPRTEIASRMTVLITSSAIDLQNRSLHVDALSRYRLTSLHFVDCLLAATAAADDLPVATFDKGFKKFADIRIDVS